MGKTNKVRFGPPSNTQWFAPQPAQNQNVHARPAQEFPRLQKPQPAAGDEPQQAAPDRADVSQDN